MRDDTEPGASKVKLAFELPRGAYATLVLKRLFDTRAKQQAKRSPKTKEKT